MALRTTDGSRRRTADTREFAVIAMCFLAQSREKQENALTVERLADGPQGYRGTGGFKIATGRAPLRDTM